MVSYKALNTTIVSSVCVQELRSLRLEDNASKRPL